MTATNHETVLQNQPTATKPATVFDFMGHHFIASYSKCNPEKLNDNEALLRTLRKAVEATGATVLNSCEQVFSNGSVTAVLLLSESHASIHTYPEHDSCFVDLFSCGDSCDLGKFDEVLTRYLQPKLASRRVLLREANIEDVTK